MKHWLAVIWIATWTAELTQPRPCGEETVTVQKKKKVRPKTCYDKHPQKYERRFGSEAEARRFAKECPTCRDWKIREAGKN